jgi:hypothetical protein
LEKKQQQRYAWVNSIECLSSRIIFDRAFSGWNMRNNKVALTDNFGDFVVALQDSWPENDSTQKILV